MSRAGICKGSLSENDFLNLTEIISGASINKGSADIIKKACSSENHRLSM